MTGKLRRIFRNLSPLSGLFGIGLLVMASDRLAHAITILGALLWVYCLSSLAVHAAFGIFPRQGRQALLVLLISFVASVFALLLWIISPLCLLETFFVISLVPIICMASGILERFETESLKEKLHNAFSQALFLGLLIVVFALVREPLGYLSLSLPGGTQGIILIGLDEGFFLPIHLIASSCGALLLLGYCMVLYNYYREKK